ncbi:hypothetical protein HDV00_012594 [Rhizophlyctis rosea]|nr:hypothetical protein HDV00_012594 [Rhizophlyctis rosea]
MPPIPPDGSIVLTFQFKPRSTTHIPFHTTHNIKFGSTQYDMNYVLSSTVIVFRKHIWNKILKSKIHLGVQVPSPRLAIAANPPTPVGWINSIPYSLPAYSTNTPHIPFVVDFTLMSGRIFYPCHPIPIRFRVTPSPTVTTTHKMVAIRFWIDQKTTITTSPHRTFEVKEIFRAEIKQNVNGEFWKNRDVSFVLSGDRRYVRNTATSGNGLLEVQHRLRVRIARDGFGHWAEFETNVVLARTDSRP